MLESLSDGAIQTQEVVCGDAFSVGRIGHHQGRSLHLHKVGHIATLDGDVFGQACSTHIIGGNVYGLPVDVVTVDVVLKLALCRVVIVYLVEHLLVKVGPLLKGKLFAEHARCYVACDEGCLDGQRSRAAHRVYEVALARPASLQYHTCSQYLIERSLHSLLAVATSVERLTR